jgi:hypothetical protein
MIRVDHIGVPGRMGLDAASFLVRLFGLDRETLDDGRFARLRVSPEFMMVFFDFEHSQPMHFAFVVNDDCVDAIPRRLKPPGSRMAASQTTRLTVGLTTRFRSAVCSSKRPTGIC